MKLIEYLESSDIAQCDFAASLNVSNGMVNQWVKGIRPIAPHQALSIERLTGGKVGRKDLRPLDYMNIWPDLAKAA